MDEIRRQLAELMDSVESSASTSRKRSFTDADVCKYYLTGLCPHDLFQNTKQYLGECRNVHSDDLREQYLRARQKSNYGYEEMTARYLRPHIDDCDRRVARQTLGGRCDTQEKASESIEASAKREVEALEHQIAAKMKEAEQLGNRGDVEGSMKAMDEMNQLNAKKNRALEEKSSKVEEAKNMYFQKLRPCDACGALLSEKDGENRLNEHFLGRIHLGFEAIRKHLKELDEYIASSASTLPRDAAFNCRPSSAPIRSEGIEEHHLNSDHHQSVGPPPRSSSSFPHHSNPPSQHQNPFHKDGGGDYNGMSREDSKRSGGGRRNDVCGSPESHHRERHPHRPHYRDDYYSRRSDDRYRQPQSPIGYRHDSRRPQYRQSRASEKRHDYRRREEDAGVGSERGNGRPHSSSAGRDQMCSLPLRLDPEEEEQRRDIKRRREDFETHLSRSSRSASVGTNRHRSKQRREGGRSRSRESESQQLHGLTWQPRFKGSRKRGTESGGGHGGKKDSSYSRSEEVEEGQIDQK